MESGDTTQRGFLASPAGIVLLGFLIIGGALLFTEHRAHVLGVLVWMPLLLCPLMHLFIPLPELIESGGCGNLVPLGSEIL